MTLQTVLSDQHNNPENHWPETNHWKRATTCSDSTCLALSVVFLWKVGSAHHHKTSGSYTHFLCLFFSSFFFSFFLAFVSWAEVVFHLTVGLLVSTFLQGICFWCQTWCWHVGVWECVRLTAWWYTQTNESRTTQLLEWMQALYFVSNQGHFKPNFSLHFNFFHTFQSSFSCCDNNQGLVRFRHRVKFWFSQLCCHKDVPTS